MNYFAKRDEKEKGLPGLLELVAWGDDVWTRVLPFLFFSLLGIPSVRPQFVLCLAVFFFLSLVSLLFVPSSLFTFPGLPRFPLFPGFFFVRLPAVFPFLLVFLYILYSLLCSGFFLVPSVSSLFFFAGSFFLPSSSSFFWSGLSLAFYRARTTGCSPVRLFFSGRRISIAGGVSLLLGLGHKIRSLSPRDYDLHEDKD